VGDTAASHRVPPTIPSSRAVTHSTRFNLPHSSMGDALDDDIEAYDMEADAEGLQEDEVRKVLLETLKGPQPMTIQTAPCSYTRTSCL